MAERLARITAGRDRLLAQPKPAIYNREIKKLCASGSSWFNSPACFHRKSNQSISPASAARPWRPPPRRCRKKGFDVTGSDQNVYPPMSTFLAGTKNRGDERLRGTEPRAQTRPGRHRQRHFARQPGSGICARPQTALLLAAGIAEGIFHPRQTLASSSPARTARPPRLRCSRGFSSTTD